MRLNPERRHVGRVAICILMIVSTYCGAMRTSVAAAATPTWSAPSEVIGTGAWPKVVPFADGTGTATWIDSDRSSIVARPLSKDGTPSAPQHTLFADILTAPEVAPLTADRGLVVADVRTGDGSSKVVGRLIDRAGTVGDTFDISDTALPIARGHQVVVAADGADGAIVAWTEWDGTNWSVHARRVGNSGALSAPFLVAGPLAAPENTNAINSLEITGHGDGTASASWSERIATPDGLSTASALKLRRVGAAGPVGGATTVASIFFGSPLKIAGHAGGSTTVAWAVGGNWRLDLFTAIVTADDTVISPERRCDYGSEGLSVPDLQCLDASAGNFGFNRYEMVLASTGPSAATLVARPNLGRVKAWRIVSGVGSAPTDLPSLAGPLPQGGVAAASIGNGDVAAVWNGGIDPNGLHGAVVRSSGAVESDKGFTSFEYGIPYVSVPAARAESGTQLPAWSAWVDDVNGLIRTARLGGPTPVQENDTDGDGLPDAWEEHGITVDDRGRITIGLTGDADQFVNLPEMGADPLHKDVFVEVDSMRAPQPHYPYALKLPDSALDRVRQAFGDAPVDNPDGSLGVHLHIDNGADTYMATIDGSYTTWGSLSRADDDLAHEARVQGSEYAITAGEQHFDKARWPVFHYAVSVDRMTSSLFDAILPCDSASGEARMAGTVFVIALGPTLLDECVSDEIRPGDPQPTDEDKVAGTFMHELGHNLGLKHGGPDSLQYKPNHVSVMSYRYQFSGLLSARWGVDYSRYDTANLPPLSENQMKERDGFGFDPYPAWRAGRGAQEKAIFTCGNALRAASLTGPVDFNCNGKIDDPPVAVNLNSTDGPDREILTTQNDWSSVQFGAGAVGGAGAGQGLDAGTVAHEAASIGQLTDDATAVAVARERFETSGTEATAPAPAPAAQLPGIVTSVPSVAAPIVTPPVRRPLKAACRVGSSRAGIARRLTLTCSGVTGRVAIKLRRKLNGKVRLIRRTVRLHRGRGRTSAIKLRRGSYKVTITQGKRVLTNGVVKVR